MLGCVTIRELDCIELGWVMLGCFGLGYVLLEWVKLGCVNLG